MMAASMLIEGYTPDEILALANDELRAIVLRDEPLPALASLASRHARREHLQMD
jgi:hypothetical protein